MKKIIALLISSLMLTACTATNTEKTATQEGYPVTVKNYNREVTVNKRPEKVLTLGPNCTELFVALGLQDYIVGTSLKNHSRGPYPNTKKSTKPCPSLTTARQPVKRQYQAVRILFTVSTGSLARVHLILPSLKATE